MGVGGLVSCDLFETRDPVGPSPGSQFACLALTNPDNVIQNVVNAYGQPNGQSCYNSTLTDSTSPTAIGFRFHPDPADSQAAPPQTFISWGKLIETQVAANIANSAIDTVSVVLKLPFES